MKYRRVVLTTDLNIFYGVKRTYTTDWGSSSFDFVREGEEHPIPMVHYRAVGVYQAKGAIELKYTKTSGNFYCG